MIDLNAVKAFATQKHEGQKYGDQPYMRHVEDVVKTFITYFPSRLLPDTLAAAWLHDTLEDTDATEEEILAISERTLDLVRLLTDKPGHNRKARHEATYPSLAEDLDAVAIKIADRISNVKASLHDPSKHKMYKKEYAYFRSLLYKDDPEIMEAFKVLDAYLA